MRPNSTFVPPDSPDPTNPELAHARVRREPPSRRTFWLIVGPLIVLVIASLVGDALAPTLFDTHPLLLIALNARNRNLFLTVNQLDAVSFYGVATLRLLASDPLFYLLGWFYGDRAVDWAEKRSTSAGVLIDRLNRLFKKAAYPIIAIAPNNIVCLLAGSSGIRPKMFLAVNLLGTIGRLVLIRVFGEITEPWIDGIGDFIARYRLWFLALTVLAAVASGWGELKDIRSAKRTLAEEE